MKKSTLLALAALIAALPAFAAGQKEAAPAKGEKDGEGEERRFLHTGIPP